MEDKGAVLGRFGDHLLDPFIDIFLGKALCRRAYGRSGVFIGGVRRSGGLIGSDRRKSKAKHHCERYGACDRGEALISAFVHHWISLPCHLGR